MKFSCWHTSRRQIVKLILLLTGGTFIFHSYNLYNKSKGGHGGPVEFKSMGTRSHEEIQSVTHGALIFPHPFSLSRTRAVEDLIFEYVIDRQSRDQRNDVTRQPAPEVVMYKREHMPGYFKRRNWHWTITRLGKYSNDVYTVPPLEVPEQRLPTVFVLGINHSGSEILSEYLKMHPHIVPLSQEVRYFDFDENLARGLDWYKSQMPLSFADQITTEMNPSYFWDHRAPRKIYKMNKNMKFILVLRDPVQRVMSLIENGGEQGAPPEELTYTVNGTMIVNTTSWAVNSGIYVKFVKQWLEYFPLLQFHVIDYEDLVSKPVAIFHNIENFLGIPHKITDGNFYYNTTTKNYCPRPFHFQEVLCPRTNRTEDKLQLSEQQLLFEFYRGYNRELFGVLGRDFNWRYPQRHIDNQTNKEANS